MLTPAELQNKIYNANYDYRDSAMNEFMRDIQENYEQLYAKCVDFNSRIEQLNSSLQYYKSIENTLQNALFLAEKVSEEKLEEASQKAEKIENDAIAKADDIVASARNQLDDIKNKIGDLQVEYEKYMVQYKSLVKGQLDLLEKEPLTLADKVNQYDMKQLSAEQEKKKLMNNSSPFGMPGSKKTSVDNNVFSNGFAADNTFSSDMLTNIENASNSVDQITNSIDNVNVELNEAGQELEHIAKDLENTAELLIGEELFKSAGIQSGNSSDNDVFKGIFSNTNDANTVAEKQETDEETKAQSNSIQPNMQQGVAVQNGVAQNGVAQGGVVQNGVAQGGVVQNALPMNNTIQGNAGMNVSQTVPNGYSNAQQYNMNMYNQNYNQAYNQQYNAQYNQNYPQYTYQQQQQVNQQQQKAKQQTEPEEKTSGVNGFFRVKKK